MRVKARLFAVYRELVGKAEIEMDVDTGNTVGIFLSQLGEVLPELKGHLGSALIAVNAEYVPMNYQLAEGDEIALIPPVSGG